MQSKPNKPVPNIQTLSAPFPFSMTNDWYQFATENHFWFQWRFAALNDLLKGEAPGQKILEIGCGNCVARGQFERSLGRPVHGCDLNRSAMELASTGLGDLYFYNIHDRRPEWKQHFDSILLLDTLEHIEDTKGFLESVRHHLKPGGQLIINVPAIQSLYAEYDRVAGHIKRYSITRLKQELSKAGFVPGKFHYWGFTLLPVLMMRSLMLRFTPKERIIASGLQPQSKLTEGILRGLMKLERTLIKWPPIGASLAGLARATDAPIPPVMVADKKK